MKLLLPTLLLTLMATQSSALSATPEELLSQAKGLYDARQAFETEAQAAERTNSLLALLTQARSENATSEVLYDFNIILAQAAYWQGGLAKVKADKIKIFDQALQYANAAKAINEDYADSYYQYLISLARWAEAKGVMESLSRKGELFETADVMKSKNTKAGVSGATAEGYGVNRVLGKVYFKLPALFGGSREKSLELLKEAYDFAPEYALNIVYYVEVLYDGKSDDKALACQIIDEFLLEDENYYNPDRLPETLEEFALARSMRKEMKGCN